jgi:uroporphyrinogen-III synthase
MHILVTRAATEALRTRGELEGLGHTVILSPLTEIVPRPESWPKGVIDALIATSSHAFDFLNEADPPIAETRRLLPLFLVGERTWEAARTHGFLGPPVIAKDAKSLSAQIIDFFTRPGRLLYLAGRDRKPDLEMGLREAAHRLDIIETYEARARGRFNPDAVAALNTGEVDAVLHYSRRSAEIFIACAQVNGVGISTLRHICISVDVASPLVKANAMRVDIADEPNEASMLALLSS